METEAKMRLRDAFRHLHELQRDLEMLINLTPTSARRNKLTDANIALGETLAHLYKAEQLPVEWRS